MSIAKPLYRVCPVLFVALAVFVAGIFSEVPRQKAGPSKAMRLYVFDCGIVPAIDVGLFNFKKEELADTRMAVPCYLVVHPKGTLMWDVGAIPDTAFNGDGAPVTRELFYATRTLKSQLNEIGHPPAEITFLALSHYHRDHTANANEFSGATWLVRKVERDAMFAATPPERVNPRTYSDLKNSKTIILSAKEYDVFGDGKVIIKYTPGHTPGHQVLILNLSKTGNVMLAGDLYHYPEEITTNRVPTFEFSAEQTRASRAMIDDYVKKTNTQLWIEHDFAANAKLRKSPAYYD